MQPGTFDIRNPPYTDIARGKGTEEGPVGSRTSASLRDIYREPRDMSFSNGNSPMSLTEYGRPIFETTYGGKLRTDSGSWSTEVDQNINSSSKSTESNDTMSAREYSKNAQDRIKYPSQTSWETAEPANSFIHRAGSLTFAEGKEPRSETNSFQGEVPHNPSSNSYSGRVSQQFSNETSQSQNSSMDDQGESVSW